MKKFILQNVTKNLIFWEFIGQSKIYNNNNKNYVDTCTLYMVEEPTSLSLAFRPRSNIGTDKSAA